MLAKNMGMNRMPISSHLFQYRSVPAGRKRSRLTATAPRMNLPIAWKNSFFVMRHHASFTFGHLSVRQRACRPTLGQLSRSEHSEIFRQRGKLPQISAAPFLVGRRVILVPGKQPQHLLRLDPHRRQPTLDLIGR